MYDTNTPTAQRPDAEAEAAMVEVIESMRSNGSRSERRTPRKSKRSKWIADIEVEIDPSMVGGGHAYTAAVRTIDIGSGGVAFRHTHYLQTGTLVHLHLPVPGDPRVLGVVSNCAHLEGRAHRVGVKFLRIERDPRRV